MQPLMHDWFCIHARIGHRVDQRSLEEYTYPIFSASHVTELSNRIRLGNALPMEIIFNMKMY